jgi:Pyruvate/2-oxoacid:ferredoxin oxidoreductase delta subunit
MPVRKIIHIDESKCDGCGLCVPSCAEGAIQVINGKARLVSETYCDGLGACLGECPRDAITIEEREAAGFDEVAVERHLAAQDRAPHIPAPAPAAPPVAAPRRPHPAGLERVLGAAGPSSAGHHHGPGGGCPGAAARMLEPRPEPSPAAGTAAGAPVSQLGNWPVQLMLLPTRAPYFQDADLLIAADCVPFAFSDFHRRFVTGKTLAIGCPKLDDAGFYQNKLSQIFAGNEIRSIHVVYMEVPCCFGLVHTVREARDASGKPIPLTLTRISIRGDEMESKSL